LVRGSTIIAGMPSSGQRFGQYRLLEQLGEGGMATVFLAEDVKHGRRVAIKFMKPGRADAVGRDRFQREIDIAARLTHPHILPLHDSGVADGQPFYVMPYIEGESLRLHLSRLGPLPVDEVLRLSREIAGALDHAHAQGLIHRDIKPENILLSHGIALVADFGVARPLREDIAAADVTRTGAQTLTRVGAIVGTPQYMAPEQALGGLDVDGRTDQYALACVVFEMLAGQPPFTGATSTEVLMRHLNEAVPPLGRLRVAIPPGVALAIERAMAKSAANRFPTATAFVDALEAAVLEPAAQATSVLSAVPRSEATVAVLPFQQVGGGSDDAEYLSEGIGDELIHALSLLEGVRVIARGSSFLFRAGRPDVRAIGEQLHVQFLVDGTLRKAGRRLRVTAELINAADGFQLWSERYDRELDDVFALEDELAASIASVLKVRLTGGATAPSAVADSAPASLSSGRSGATARVLPVGGPRPTSIAAYERYLMGLQCWNRRTPQDLDRAVEHFGASVQSDPAFAAAWGAMALCYVTQHIYGLRRPDELVTLARAAVHNALRIDAHQVAALTARACVRAIHDWDFVAAEQDFRRCLDADPSNATAHQWYAMNLLAPLGRFAEARAQLEQARALDPLSPSVVASLGFVSYLEQGNDRAVDQFRRALVLDPTFAAALYFLGLTLTAAGRLDEAIAALEAAASGMARSPEVVAALGAAYAEHGDRVRAADLLEELERQTAERYVSPALTAIVRLALGDRDAALADLERALDVRAVEILWLDVRPTYAPLRQDPRFQTILARRASGRRAATIG
jgi:eukaryotic-like serine/threonine-protein kinase